MNTFTFWKGLLAVLVPLAVPRGLCGAVPPTNPPPPLDQRKNPAFQEHPPGNRERRERFEHLTPQERETLRKIWRARIERRIEDLKKKKSDGTITDQETKSLERWELRLKRWDQRSTPDKPSPDKPADKTRDQQSP